MGGARGRHGHQDRSVLQGAGREHELPEQVERGLVAQERPPVQGALHVGPQEPAPARLSTKQTAWAPCARLCFPRPCPGDAKLVEAAWSAATTLVGAGFGGRIRAVAVSAPETVLLGL